MPQHKPYMRWSLRFPTRQSIRLLLNHEKPRECDSPGCQKPATGEDEGKVYCVGHFVAAVRKHWGA